VIGGLAAGDYTLDVGSINSVDIASAPLRFAFQAALAVPEPTAFMLVAMAACPLAWRVLRRR
jgi:hypothetical protein